MPVCLGALRLQSKYDDDSFLLRASALVHPVLVLLLRSRVTVPLAVSSAPCEMQ